MTLDRIRQLCRLAVKLSREKEAKQALEDQEAVMAFFKAFERKYDSTH